MTINLRREIALIARERGFIFTRNAVWNIEEASLETIRPAIDSMVRDGFLAEQETEYGMRYCLIADCEGVNLIEPTVAERRVLEYVEEHQVPATGKGPLENATRKRFGQDAVGPCVSMRWIVPGGKRLSLTTRGEAALFRYRRAA